MTTEIKSKINETIDTLLEQARETGSVMLIVFQEKDGQNGKHLSAHGSGIDLKNLLVDSARHNDGLRKVLKATVTEL